MLVVVGYAKVHIANEHINIEKDITSWIESRDKNLTRQQYDYSCGAASLSSILSYFYGLNVSEKDILDSILIKKGIDPSQKANIESNKDLKDTFDISFADLALYASEKGFKSVGVALRYARIIQAKNARDNICKCA